jgi:GT2 family glycosyltransferase
VVETADLMVIMENQTTTLRLGGNTCEARVMGIVVTYNGRKWIDKCLSSLLQNQHVEGVIVMDNGSTDGTCEAARRHGSRVRVQENGHNLGFGKANNVAIQQAQAAGASHVFLLNQDAWIEQNGIDRLLEYFAPDAGWGILCPMQLSGNGKALDRLFLGCLPETLVSDLCLGNTVAKVYPVRFINAAAWLISREALEATGGFDPIFSVYGEDDDYAKRLRRENFHMGLCPGIKVFHDREERELTPVEARNRAQALGIMYLKYSERPLAIGTTIFLVRTMRRALGKAFALCWTEVLLQCFVTARVLGMLGRIRRSRGDLRSRAGSVRKSHFARADDRSVEVIAAD